MKFWHLLCLIAAVMLAACNLAVGQVTIDGPDKIAPYKFCDLTVSGDWESAVWEFDPAANVDSRYSVDGMSVTWVAPPGTYTVRATVVSFTAKKMGQGKRQVVVGASDTNPPQPPTPSGKVAWVIVLHETSETNPADAAVLNGQEWAAYDVQRAIVDVTRSEQVEDYKTWHALSKGKTLPYYCFATATGGVLWESSRPTEAVLVEKLKLYGAKQAAKLDPKKDPSPAGCPGGQCRLRR